MYALDRRAKGTQLINSKSRIQLTHALKLFKFVTSSGYGQNSQMQM